MKRDIIFSLFVLVCLHWSCKDSEENDPDAPVSFPVHAFLQSQVAHVDTSLYRIEKIVTIDSISDTSYIRREDFREAAKDFLNSPDLTSKKLKSKYRESKFYEESINRIIVTYEPLQDDLEIRKQEVMIMPNQGSGDQIKTIILDKMILNKDSMVQKKMLWHADERFQVVTTIQKPGRQERTERLIVKWE